MRVARSRRLDIARSLQYSVRVSESNPALANLMLEQFGGPQGELAAAMRYFTQALAEGVDAEAGLFRSLQGAGNDSHVTQVLYGGGPALVNSGGQLRTAGYIDSIGEPTADLGSNIAAEARAKIVYERLINVTSDPGVKEALTFLMTREIAHQQSFEKALYAIEPIFLSGKLPGMPQFANMCINTSQSERDMRGSWNSDENFDFVSSPGEFLGMDGGDGRASVDLSSDQQQLVKQMAARARSNPDIKPQTGAELGAEGSRIP